MRFRALFLLSVAGLLALPRLVAADQGTDPVLTLMERAADWQLAHPDSDRKEGQPDGWVNAAFYAGVMALSHESASPRFHDAMVRMGEANHWQPAARTYHADDLAVTQTYLELYLQDRDPRMLAPTQARFDFILAHPKTGGLEMDKVKNPHGQDRWSWCDALFMAPPAFARLTKATGNPAYLEFALREWAATSDYLYDRDEHLFFRDSTLFARTEKNGRKIFWARGNGWVLAGLARLLDYLPADHPARPRLEQQLREIAAKVLSLQQPDGFWRSSLLDPASYTMQETSGTGFYCYAFAWGINRGLLERAAYEPAVRRAWAALAGCVEADGKLTHVQPIGFTPVTFDPGSTQPFGVGAFLLAGSEVRRLKAP